MVRLTIYNQSIYHLPILYVMHQNTRVNTFLLYAGLSGEHTSMEETTSPIPTATCVLIGKFNKENFNSFQHILYLLYLMTLSCCSCAHIHTNYPTAPPSTVPLPFLSTDKQPDNTSGIGNVYCSIKYFYSKENCLNSVN